jgi:holliday junction DNA helicase RuvA
MIASLRGLILEKGYDHVLVEVGGVGLRVTVSLSTLAALRDTGSEARLLTYLQVREDALTLFGFATPEERLAFEQCISVQQVGPKLAMSILSTLSPSELAAAVRAEDVARLRKIPGVGNKTAERLVLELRDKLDKAGLIASTRSAQVKPATAAGTTSAQVASALQNLGYKPAEAERAAESATADASAQLSVAELVKKALRALAD